jgi:hypothetical protein
MSPPAMSVFAHRIVPTQEILLHEALNANALGFVLFLLELPELLFEQFTSEI